jgi:hypothetical protein
MISLFNKPSGKNSNNFIQALYWPRSFTYTIYDDMFRPIHGPSSGLSCMYWVDNIYIKANTNVNILYGAGGFIQFKVLFTFVYNINIYIYVWYI